MGVNEFKEKFASDKEFAEKFKDVKTVEELVEKVSKEGYEFTVEDVKNSSGLSDEGLEDAAGGTYFYAHGWFVVKDKGSLFYKDSYYDSRLVTDDPLDDDFKIKPLNPHKYD